MRHNLILLLAVILIKIGVAAPMIDHPAVMRQPDGTAVPVLINGDEFYAEMRDSAGNTLRRDPQGWLCFTELNADSSELLPTHRWQPNNSRSVTASHSLSTAQKAQKAAKARTLLTQQRSRGLLPMGPRVVIGEKVGLTILVDFPDQPAEMDSTIVESFLNSDTYAVDGPWGPVVSSVKNYFSDISSGQLTYTNQLVNYMRAAHPKSYYEDPSIPFGERADMLVRELLDSLDNRGFDFSTLSTHEGTTTIMAVNILYAGATQSNSGSGLWPHKSYVEWQGKRGLRVEEYQISPLESPLTLGTFCHENGHLLLGLPDLYPYEGELNWVRQFDLMGYGTKFIPAPLNPWFRFQLGWLSLTDITDDSRGLFTLKPNQMDQAICYRNPTDSTELYLFEYIQRKDRWRLWAPGSGMVLWKVDRDPRATNMFPEEFRLPYIAVVGLPFEGSSPILPSHISRQALLLNRPGEALSSTTTPSLRWRNNHDAALELYDLSDTLSELSFFAGPPITSVVPTLHPNHLSPEIRLQGVRLVVSPTHLGVVRCELFSPQGKKLADASLPAGVSLLISDLSPTKGVKIAKVTSGTTTQLFRVLVK